MAKTDSKAIATQTFKTDTEKSCKHVVRFKPDGKADVGGTAVEELSNSIYVDKLALHLLGNPEKITVTVSAA